GGRSNLPLNGRRLAGFHRLRRDFRRGRGLRGAAVWRRATEGDALFEELCEVEDLDAALDGGGNVADGGLEHLHAEGAGDGDEVGAGLDGLGCAGVVDASAAVLLDPHVRTAGAAAEGAALAALHLDLGR